MRACVNRWSASEARRPQRRVFHAAFTFALRSTNASNSSRLNMVLRPSFTVGISLFATRPFTKERETPPRCACAAG